MAKSIFFSQFSAENSQRCDVKLNLSKIIANPNQICNFEYYCVAEHLNLIILMKVVQWMHLFSNILNVYKIPNFGQFNAEIPNSKGMGHIPKMVRKSPGVIWQEDALPSAFVVKMLRESKMWKL